MNKVVPQAVAALECSSHTTRQSRQIYCCVFQGKALSPPLKEFAGV